MPDDKDTEEGLEEFAKRLSTAELASMNRLAKQYEDETFVVILESEIEQRKSDKD